MDAALAGFLLFAVGVLIWGRWRHVRATFRMVRLFDSQGRHRLP